jgi:hypothetical protein
MIMKRNRSMRELVLFWNKYRINLSKHLSKLNDIELGDFYLLTKNDEVEREMNKRMRRAGWLG